MHDQYPVTSLLSEDNVGDQPLAVSLYQQIMDDQYTIIVLLPEHDSISVRLSISSHHGQFLCDKKS